MSELLLEELSPLGNAVAKVEDDGRAVYFYLYFAQQADGESDQGFKACWVRNRRDAPQAVEHDRMEEGFASMMPASYCKSKSGGPPLNRNALRIVWLEELDAAALLEESEILAIIPSWSGEGSFHGYSRDGVGEGPFAWELASENVLHDRVRQANEFWTLWSDDDFWTGWRDERIAAVEATMGPHAKYYAIDGDQFPPKTMLRFDLGDRFIFVTVGVSLFCQPKVEQYFDDPSPHRRIELAAAIDRRCTNEELQRFGSYLSSQTEFPWSQITPLGFGHTMPCDSTPASCGGRRFSAVVLAHSLPGIIPIELPGFRGDPVNLLWFYAITNAERSLAVDQGTERLLELLSIAGHDGVIRERNSVVP